MYKTIMVPLDGSELAECVLPHVEAIAKAAGTETVTLVRATETFFAEPMGGGSYFSNEQITEWDKSHKTVAENYLGEVADRLDAGKATIKTEVLTGRPTHELVEYTKKHNFDLAIIATHGRSGASRWTWGSVADRLLHASRAPVLMITSPGCAPGV
jgi:nucleotide-binding universal stress UspA family protein